MAKSKKKKDITLNDLAVMMASGFDDVQSQINGLRDSQNGLITSQNGLITSQNELRDSQIAMHKEQISMKRELVWIKDTLEKHTSILKRLDEERIFTLNYVKRLEKEIEKIKIHLKIA